MNALVASQAVRPPLALRGVGRSTRTVRSAVAMTPTVAMASKSQRSPLLNNKRGSDASRLSAVRNNQQAAAAASSSGLPDVIPGDYRIGGVLLTVATFLGPVCHLWPQFFVHGILGSFLALQASRVRFRFTDTDLDVVIVDPGADDSVAAKLGTESSGDNKLQGGGANKWSFESVVNWEYWFPGFPVLVYYKETQTRPEGQPHFFPIIMDGKKLYEVMLERFPPSMNPKPPVSEWNLDTAFQSTKVGRSIKESLTEEQVASLKDTTGFPLIDKK
eukprot:CAMPEP_0197617602 /NCGR_PEP_ID=MMETSP1326-20131121/61115_1 /TAXON_ID=1155430 /ORGANISM="Genus nov. species nov., Strain RCC2288" /LENGTH=273 /DNA_ID=CAMNT_0043186497 /DNA_START=35 /DNA_END=856 /DNA_ORIENTATION=+